MKKALTINKKLFHFNDNQERVEGPPPGLLNTAHIYGNATGLTESAQNITGDVSNIIGAINLGLHGEVSDLSGDITGTTGVASRKIGDLTECKIGEEDREKGVDLDKLVAN